MQSTTFIELPESPLTENRNSGGGLRIFSDKRTPNDMVDRSVVKVKAKLSAPIQGVPIYFKSYDIDEPSTDSLPIDTGGNSNGSDNRGISFGSISCSATGNACSFSPSGTEYTMTDAKGEATVYFSVSGLGRLANPGDNFAIQGFLIKIKSLIFSIGGGRAAIPDLLFL